MKILVTGHLGYLGSVLTKVLLDKGHHVIGLDSGYFAGCLLGKAPVQVTELGKDIRDVEASDLVGLDAVMHLAALCNDPLGNLNPDWTFQINHHGSVRLAKMAKEAGVKRFLFSSSCSMYGAASGDDLLDEKARLNPVTPYAVSKVKAEEEIAALASPDFSPVFLRNATAYGLSPRFRADLVVNNLVGWALTTGKIKILSDGSPWRPLVHAEDIASAFLCLAEADKKVIHNQAFNIGAKNENYQVRDIANLVKEIIPEAEVEFAGSGEADKRNYRVSFEKLASCVPQFKARWNVRRGILQVREGLAAVKFSLSDLEGKKYLRVKQLTHLIESQSLDADLRWANPSNAAKAS